jgi:hypothetical protein
MATCGNCKSTGVTVAHVKDCYSTVITMQGLFDQAVVDTHTPEFSGFVEKFTEALEVLPVTEAHAKTVDDFKPMALTTNTVPDSKYAVPRAEGLVYYEVSTGKKGKWKGFQFVDRLTGAPGDWRRTALRAQARKNILAELAINPKEAAILFSRTFTVCAACSSPLSDAESIARGLGPVCAEKF